MKFPNSHIDRCSRLLQAVESAFDVTSAREVQRTGPNRRCELMEIPSSNSLPLEFRAGILPESIIGVQSSKIETPIGSISTPSSGHRIDMSEDFHLSGQHTHIIVVIAQMDPELRNIQA